MKNNGNNLFIASVFALMGGIVLFVTSMCQTLPVKEVQETFRSPAEFEPSPKPIIVAVIDTGFDFKSDWSSIIKAYPKYRKPRTCKYGNVDFTGKGLQDNHGHGTHIAGLIAQYADNSNYCIVVMKYFDKSSDPEDHLEQTEKAFQRAIDLKVDIINYSGGGESRSQTECSILKKALDVGIVVVAAAGNQAKNINETPYYPAMCDDRIKAVGNTFDSGAFVPSSNFSDDGPTSKHLYTQMGWNVMGLAPNNQLYVMTGTSQAAAIQTGKIIKAWKKR